MLRALPNLQTLIKMLREMQDKNNIRVLKVYQSWQKRFMGWVGVPQIKFTGKWLEKSGFSTTTIIHVETVGKGKLIVTAKEILKA